MAAREATTRKACLVTVAVALIMGATPAASMAMATETAADTLARGGPHGAVAGAGGGIEGNGMAKKNVLFVAIDDLRPEIGAFHPWTPNDTIVTPNMDRVAAEGTLFERPIVQIALCAPSRTSFLTSLRPDRTRIYTIGPFFRSVTPRGRAAVTLPQAFKDQGWSSESYGKIFHVSPNCYGPHGPVYNVSAPCLNDPASWTSPAYFPTPYHETNNATAHDLPVGRYNLLGNSWAAAHEVVGPGYGPLPDELISAHAVAAIKRLAASDKPFFLGAGFIKPHLPQVFRDTALLPYANVTLPSVANNPYPPIGSPKIAWANFLDAVAPYTNVKAALHGNHTPRPLPVEMARAQKRAYHAATTFIDMQVGMLLAALDEAGVSNNTIVVIQGDHGWKLGEHSGWGKKTNFMYDARGLLIVKDPGQGQRGGRANALVEYIDVMPTLLERAGAQPAPTPIDGTSFGALLDDASAAHRDTGYYQYPAAEAHAKGVQHMGYSLVNDQWRLTLWVSYPGHDWHNTTAAPDFDAVVATELYDQVNDPQENVNVAQDVRNAGVVASLSKQLRAHVMQAFPGGV